MKQAQNTVYEHQRGEIRESAIKALVTDKLFRTRIENNRKGKGSYQRNAKHRKAGYERSERPFKNVPTSNFKWAFLLAFSN
ncbi:hypothetical protein AP460_00975 [Actinobacillus pleuropneumoniae]|uniref:alternative ribosome-rescue factor A n=1 Tax=Actinobacillus pleuropneumoniae TaxID=715 RepID=UPI0005854BBA|nr:ribosome alternative rescue factor ArfA [Actinobacillus pleuropneumoniae]KIE91158.1 hypothetical protein AP518_00918 [Actinobacillus pleuropneumoniae]KIE91614.1 hypothetical protein AP1022_00837 [Actinobacillus pleuropneumoniae]KIE91896.1 hypothetical protein AP460_00975 [Actinobacillus pleuropneumoniae]KIE97031.1 hypothetical protein AP5651_00916 [Actinobacillus pleuropneumoniae]KIE98014.1 hypothetical protein AP780_01044 [Actinobacillus pleuropneumoniae]